MKTLLSNWLFGTCFCKITSQLLSSLLSSLVLLFLQNDIFMKTLPLRQLQLLSKSLIVATISTIGCLSGLAPAFSGNLQIQRFIPAVTAQTVSPPDISNYARAVLALEPIRKDALARIEKILGRVPSIVCSEPKTLNALSREAREIAVNFCNKSKEIVESNGLTTNTFNQITIKLQNDPALQQQIQQEMLRLQQSYGN